MMFNATCNNTSVILWWSVLFVEETRVPRENHFTQDTTTTSQINNVVQIYEVENSFVY